MGRVWLCAPEGTWAKVVTQIAATAAARKTKDQRIMARHSFETDYSEKPALWPLTSNLRADNEQGSVYPIINRRTCSNRPINGPGTYHSGKQP
jgi:hypothetical protein